MADDGAARPPGIDTTQEQLKISTREPTLLFIAIRKRKKSEVSLWCEMELITSGDIQMNYKKKYFTMRCISN